MENQTLIGKNFNGFVVKMMDDFQYTDTIDGSVSKEQVFDTINLCVHLFIMSAI